MCVCTFFTTVAEAYLFWSAHKSVVKAVLEASVNKRKQEPTYMTVRSIVKLSGPPRNAIDNIALLLKKELGHQILTSTVYASVR